MYTHNTCVFCSITFPFWFPNLTTSARLRHCLHWRQEADELSKMDLFKFGFSSDKEQTQTKRKGNEDSKKRYEKEKRKRQFCSKWKDDFPWLEFDEESGVMFCIPCRKYEKSGRFVDGTDNFRIDAIKSHNQSVSHEIHRRNYDIKQKQSTLSTVYTTHTGEIEAECSSSASRSA